MKENQKAVDAVAFYKLFGYADWKDVVLMCLGTIGAVANGCSTPILTLIMVDAFNSLIIGQVNVLDLVSKASLNFVYLSLGAFFAAFLQVACWTVTGERQAARIRKLYLRSTLRQDVAFFDKETNTGEVVERMSSDTLLIQDAMGEKVGKMAQLLSTFGGGFIIALSRGWLLTLFMLASSIVPIMIISGFISRFIAMMASRRQTAYAKSATIAEQTIGSIRTVASFTGEKQAVASYKESLVNAHKASTNEGLTTGLGLGIVMFCLFGSYGLTLWYGGEMIKNNGYTGRQVLNVMFAVMVASASVRQVVPCLSAFAAGRAAAFKVFETINRKPVIDSTDPSGKTLDDIRGDIELKDVHFSYPTRPDEKIFSGFSLFIQSGTTAALVGQSGSGKSSVISLIERFYDPQSGEVLIDGINLKDFQLKWIRQKLGIVSQEPVLFAASIKDNIAYGKHNATNEEIEAAAMLANAVEFIDKLPQGLETTVGDHGTQLSGGQKQRIAIARAILKDPKILLLDEATSALDAESERIVQDALDKIMLNRTTVVVAHRLSTVRNADMIVVIQQGEMIEKGSHFELLKNPDGAYSQLIQLQEMNSDSEHQSPDNEYPSRATIESTGDSNKQTMHEYSDEVTKVAPSTDVNDPPTETEHKLKNLLLRLAYYSKSEIIVLVMGVISSIVNGTLFPLFGVIINHLIVAIYDPPDKLKKDTEFWALILFLLGLGMLLANSTVTYFFSVAGSKLTGRIRSLCFEKVVSMEIGWFDEPDHSIGAVGARLSSNAIILHSLIADVLSHLIVDLTSIVGAVGIAFVTCWQLASIFVVMLPLMIFNGVLQMKFIKDSTEDAKTKYEQASKVANSAVGAIRTVASFCAEDKVMDLFNAKCEEPVKTGIKQGLVGGIGFGISSMLLYCVYATAFYAGSRLVEDGTTTSSKVIRVFFVFSVASAGIARSSSTSQDLSKIKAAASSIFAILDRKSKIDPSDQSGQTLEDVKGEIELKHVMFSYPTRPDTQIFNDLSLIIPSSKTMALVGESGSGKSTVIALLQRFYDPNSGLITLDGVETQKLQLNWLRKQMGLVSQEPVLFNETISANIAYGKDYSATETEIIEAAKLANAHEFISSLEQGYETVVGERGVQLSGGQKQRVAIARAIIKNPKILLLDEATSALDAESERVVQVALNYVMENRTTVIVAHRLSTIRGADEIAVFKDGGIVEKGNHSSLINIEDGIYASLVSLQTSNPS